MWRHINASNVAAGPRQPPTDEWDPLAQPKCALVNAPAHLPPSTTCGVCGPSSFSPPPVLHPPRRRSLPALRLVPAAIKSSSLPCSSTGDPRGARALPFISSVGAPFPPQSALPASLVLPVSAVAESSTLPSSSTSDPRGCAAPPAPSPQTLCALVLVRPAAADTTEEQSSAANSSRRQRLKGRAPQWRNQEQFSGGAAQNFILNVIKTSTLIIRVANFLNTVIFFTITEGPKN
jgi:hypothetical protein